MTRTGVDTDSPARIFRLANAFCDAKALLTAVELGLFSVLRNGPATREEIRRSLGLHGRGLSDWLDLLVCLEVLEQSGDGYRNAADVDRFLVPGGPTYIGGFLERSNHLLFPVWGGLTCALRTGTPQGVGQFDDVLNDPDTLARFAGMMDGLTSTLATPLLESYDGWNQHGSVLDVGGCRGYMASRIVTAHPHLTACVVDLPQLSPLFDELVAEHGVAERMTFHGADFFTDPLPSADLVILGHALHDWSEQQRKFLVHKAFDSVLPGGVLLVYDRMLDTGAEGDADHDRRARIENLVISIDMLLVTEGGCEYPPAELREHARSAGFEWIGTHPLGDYDTLAVCRKPG